MGKSKDPLDTRPVIIDKTLTNEELWTLTRDERYRLSGYLFGVYWKLASAKFAHVTVNGYSYRREHDEFFNPPEVEVVSERLIKDRALKAPESFAKKAVSAPSRKTY